MNMVLKSFVSVIIKEGHGKRGEEKKGA